MSKVIVFDFNRTLYDPERRELCAGAVEVLKECRERGYRLVLLAQAAPQRAELLRELKIQEYFVEVLMVENKTPRLFTEVAERHNTELGRSYVIGDRALKEIEAGQKVGWQTIWVRQGRFAGETAETPPTHTVTRLVDVLYII